MPFTFKYLGILRTATDSPPIQFRSFHALKHSLPYSESDTLASSITMKLLLPASNSYKIAYGLSGANVLCMPLKDTEEVDTISFGPGGNNAQTCNNK